MKNRGWYLEKPKVLNLKDMPMPEPKENEVLIKIAANGICGSDIHYYLDGKVGGDVFDRPYVPGHEASGTIAGVAKGCKDIKEGDRVTIEPGIPCGVCDLCKQGRYNVCYDMHFLSSCPINGTFCEYITLPYRFAFKIPDRLSLEDASLAEPAAVGLQAVKQARSNLYGLTGIIVGAGPIGLMTLQAFKAAGGGVAISVDHLDNRLEVAKNLGADVVCKHLDPRLQMAGDIVFECAGDNDATKALLGYAKRGATIVQVGWPQDVHVPLDIDTILRKEVYYAGLYRYANCYDAVVTWLGDGRIKSDGFITHRFPFDECDKAFEFASYNKEIAIKTVVLS